MDLMALIDTDTVDLALKRLREINRTSWYTVNRGLQLSTSTDRANDGFRKPIRKG